MSVRGSRLIGCAVAQRVQHAIQDGGTETTPENCNTEDCTSLLEVDDVISTPSRGSVTTSLSTTMASERTISSSVAANHSTEISKQINNADSKPQWKIYFRQFEPSSGNANSIKTK